MLRAALPICIAALALAACGQRTEGGAAPAGPPTGSPAPVVQPPLPAGPVRHILAFGDSLFAGYGVDPSQSYPAQLQAALRKAGVAAQITNAGVTGDTTAAGLQRLAFTLDSMDAKPDLAILELGANDMLRGLDPVQTRRNLIAMLEEFARRGIPVLLMGMRAPPNYGPDYQHTFDAIYPALAARKGVTLVPFWLESIYTRPALFQADHLHPTAQGIALLAEATRAEVEKALPPVSAKAP